MYRRRRWWAYEAAEKGCAASGWHFIDAGARAGAGKAAPGIRREGQNSMAIKIDHLNYVYSEGTAFEKHALKDVNLEIPDGQFIGVIGHTGSGKSTLIQHLNGLLKGTSGAIYYQWNEHLR